MTIIKALIETEIFQREILPFFDAQDLVTLSAVNKDLQSLVVPIALKQLCKMGRFFSSLDLLGRVSIKRLTAQLKVTPDIEEKWLNLYAALLKKYFERVEVVQTHQRTEIRRGQLVVIPPKIEISNIPNAGIINAARVSNLFFLEAFDHVQHLGKNIQAMAARNACYSGSLPCIEYFIKKKIIGSAHYPFQRALYDSAISSSLNAVLYLCGPDRGDIKATTEKGENILHFALNAEWLHGVFIAYRCTPEFLKALLALNSSVHQVNHLKETPLTLAIRARDPELVKLLKENGAQMREYDELEYSQSFESVINSISASKSYLNRNPLNYSARQKLYNFQKQLENLRKIRELFPASFSRRIESK